MKDRKPSTSWMIPAFVSVSLCFGYAMNAVLESGGWQRYGYLSEKGLVMGLMWKEKELLTQLPGEEILEVLGRERAGCQTGVIANDSEGAWFLGVGCPVKKTPKLEIDTVTG